MKQRELKLRPAFVTICGSIGTIRYGVKEV